MAGNRPRLPHDPDLREIHFGAWELRRHDEVEAEARGAVAAPGVAPARDGAEALILGCTAEYGVASEMQDILIVPVLEAIPAALKYAEMMADSAKNFGWYPSRKHGSAAPPEEEIAAWGLFEGKPPIGREIQIGEEH